MTPPPHLLSSTRGTILCGREGNILYGKFSEGLLGLRVSEIELSPGGDGSDIQSRQTTSRFVAHTSTLI